jgi:uncharacterized PurR-regulated membrane protein YhhQ (DUF165 family)
MIAIFEFVILYPPSAVMTNNQSYVDVLSTAPRLVLFGTVAMFAGDIANNYVLAKLKVWTDGRYISVRFVTSTCHSPKLRPTSFAAVTLLRRGFWRGTTITTGMQTVRFSCSLTVAVESARCRAQSAEDHLRRSRVSSCLQRSVRGVQTDCRCRTESAWLERGS